MGLPFCDVIRQDFPERGSLVGRYAVVLSRWLLMFRKIVLPLSLGSGASRLGPNIKNFGLTHHLKNAGHLVIVYRSEHSLYLLAFKDFESRSSYVHSHSTCG
jgi:hypothetical protein